MSQFGDVLNLPLRHAGKVRELYTVDDGGTERILMVATDNISAFDHVLATPIPDKGAILTQLSLWWFAQLADLVDNHVVSTDVPPAVAGRATLVEALDMKEAQRAYEANLNVIETARAMEQRTLDILKK